MIKKIANKLTGKTTVKEAEAKKATAKTEKTTSAKRTTKKAAPEALLALIEKKAYELFQERGFGHGDDQSDWYEAEKIVSKKSKK